MAPGPSIKGFFKHEQKATGSSRNGRICGKQVLVNLMQRIGYYNMIHKINTIYSP